MHDHMRAELVTAALEAAVAFRGRARMDDTIFHSDKDCQYTSSDFAKTCDKLGSAGRWALPEPAWTTPSRSRSSRR
jgi:transposase InsO family protein